jgi:hypothetical protein
MNVQLQPLIFLDIQVHLADARTSITKTETDYKLSIH